MANNKFQLKRTSVTGRTPNTTNSSNTSFIDAGELAVNLTDKKLYSSDGSAYFEVGANLTSLSVTNGSIIVANNSSTALRVTQEGTGNAIVIEDSTNPDSSPFVISANGWTVLGANTPSNILQVVAPNSSALGQGIEVTTSANGYFRLASGSSGAFLPAFSGQSTLTTAAYGLFFNGKSANNTDTSVGVLTFSARYNDGTSTGANVGSTQIATQFLNFVTPLVTILGNGNMGIGNTAPASKLVVAGTSSYSGNASFAANVTVTGTAILNAISANGSLGLDTQVLTSNGSSVYWSASGGGGKIAGPGLTSNASHYEVLANTGIIANATGTFVNSAYIATIDANSSTYANSSVTNTFTVGTASYFVANGNFGVGTNAPNRKLFVAGPVGGTPSLTTSDGEIAFFQSTTTQGISIGADGASPYGSWLQVKRPTNDGNSYPLLLNPVDGNVGIGNTNPTQKLHVQGTAYATSDLRSPIYYDSDNTTYYAELAGSTSLIASGNVAIGTTAPNGKLTVSQSSQSSDSNYQIQYNRLSVANTAVTAGRTKSLFYGLIDNYNQNKSADGLTQYSSISAGAVLYVYNGSSSTGGDANSHLYGTINYVQNWANGATSNAISIATGTYNQVSPVRGAITSATGSSNEITQANSSYANIATAIATRSVITGNTTGGSLITTGYLFYGNYSGAQPTTAYGVYITGEQKNYFSANVGIGTTTPNVPLAVNGAIVAANGIGVGYGAGGTAPAAGIGMQLQNNRIRIQFTDNTADNTTNVLEFLRGNGTGNQGWLSITADGSNGLKAMALSLTGADRLKIIANGNIGIGNTAPANKLFVTGDIGLDGISVRDTATSTTTATTQIALFEYPVATYDSCDVVIKAVSGGQRHTTKLLVTANSTVAVATEYGAIQTGASLFTVDVDVTLANTRILITPASTTSTVFKSSYELITS